MIKKNRNYSSIKSHDELLKAISEISNEIELVSTQLDSSIAHIKYKYSFAHLMEMIFSRFQIFKQLLEKITGLISTIKSNSSAKKTN